MWISLYHPGFRALWENIGKKKKKESGKPERWTIKEIGGCSMKYKWPGGERWG